VAADFCRRWLSAWTGGAERVDELLSYYSIDAKYVDPARPNGLSGYAELRPYFERLLGRYPQWTWTAIEIWPTEIGFTLKWRACLDARSCHGLDLVEIADGRIKRNEVYFDPGQLFGS
jgi:hypothetical protein